MVFAILITMLWSPVMFGTYLRENSGIDNKLFWESNLWHQDSKEKLQRIKNENERKETFDKFTMNRRKTFAVTPAFEMHLQNKNIKPIISVSEILDEGVEKHEIVTVRDDNDVSVVNLTGTNATDTRTSHLQNVQDWYFTHGRETTKIHNIEPMLDVLSKQHKLIEKLAFLYNGVKNKENNELQQENEYVIDKGEDNKENDVTTNNNEEGAKEAVYEVTEDKKDEEEENNLENEII